MLQRTHRLAVALATTAALVALGSSGLTAQPAWRLSPRPLLTIGSEGDAHAEFLRVSGAARLADGRIVVANGGSLELRVFSSIGQFLKTIGRDGAGPGEFKALSWFGVAGDTLLVADRSNVRITRYLPDGTLLGTLQITATDSLGRFYITGRLATGAWVVATSTSPTLEGPQRMYRDTARVGLLAPDAAGRVRWLGGFPGLSVFVFNPDKAARGKIAGVPPFAAMAVSAAARDRILVGDTDRSELLVYDQSGARTGVIRLPLKPVPPSEAAIAARRAEELGTTRGDPVAVAYVNTLFTRGVLPKSLPLYQGLLLEKDGAIWIRPYPNGPTQSLTALVLAPDGKLLATVDFPSAFRAREIGRDYVLGVHTDADGVERVQLYGLTRSP